MNDHLSKSALRVQKALETVGAKLQVVEMPASTRTARDAAQAVGCEVANIAKSLIFTGCESGEPVLVVASGANRVDTEVLKAALGEKVRMATPEFVRERTGYAIGGVPPLGHDTPIPTLIDQDLMALERIWAAAGTPNALFELTPDLLERITGGRILCIC